MAATVRSALTSPAIGCYITRMSHRGVGSTKHGWGGHANMRTMCVLHDEHERPEDAPEGTHCGMWNSAEAARDVCLQSLRLLHQ